MKNSLGGSRPPKARTTVLFTMVAAGVAQGFGRFSYALAIPSLVQTQLHSIVLAGTLGTVNVGAYLLGTVLVSVAAIRHRPDVLVKWGLAGSTSGLLVITLAPNVPALVVGMLVAGFSGAFVWVPAPSIAASSVEVSKRGMAMGVTGAGVGLFMTLASLISHFTAELGGSLPWRGLFGMEAFAAVVTLLVSLSALHSPGDLSQPPVGMKISSLRRVPGWIGLTGAYSAFGFVNAVFVTFAVSVLVQRGHFSTMHASVDFGVMGFVSIFGGIVVGRISDGLGRIPVLSVNFLVMIISCVFIVTAREPYAFLATALYGIPLSGIPNSIVAYLGDHLPAAALASAFGAVTILFGIFQAFAPQLGGALAQASHSFTLVYLLAGLVSLVGLGFSASCGIARRRPTYRMEL